MMMRPLARMARVVVVAGVVGIVIATATSARAEDLNPPGNVRITHDQTRLWETVSWNAVSGASRYEIWGKVQVPGDVGINYIVGPRTAAGTAGVAGSVYTGYSYYGAFNTRTSVWTLLGTTTSTSFAFTYQSYLSYMSYTEYAEYSPYGCYRIVAISDTAPTTGLDGPFTRGLPSAEVHPALGTTDLNPPDSVTYTRDAVNSQVQVKWAPVTNATHYEIYRKRQKHFVNTSSTGWPAVEWAFDNSSTGIKPYAQYNTYHAFRAIPNYHEFDFVAATAGDSVTLNVLQMAGLGGYHEYSAYSIYSSYLDYGVFKVVAIIMGSADRSPASAEAVNYVATSVTGASTSSGGVCFLTSARRRE